MITTNNPEPQVNFWQELVTKVQQISNRTRQQQDKPHIANEQSIRRKCFSRFQAMEAYHHSQEEAKLLSNRIKYLQHEKDRQNRTLVLVKQKYEKLMEVRQRSLKEKQDNRKQITTINQLISEEVESKASRIKQDRGRITKSVQRVRLKNESQANSIRQMSENIQQIIRHQKEIQVEQKKANVEKLKQKMELSRMKLSQMQEDRVRLGKQQHKQIIKKQLQKNLSIHKRNSLLRHKLQQSISIACNSKQESQNLLKQYQTLMTPSQRVSRIRHLNLIQSH